MRSIYISDRRTCAFVSVTSCNAISRNLHIFLYARGSKFHRISAEILFHSAAFSIIPFLEQAPYPVEEARAKPIPPRICWYILQFLGFEFDFSTRVFFFLFVHGLDIDSQRNFRFASRVPSRVSLEDDSRIVDFIALSTFTARRRSRGPQEVTNLLLDVKGREVCSSPSSVITIQSKNKIPVALSSSFTALSWSTVKLRWSISFFFKGHNTCSFGWLIFLHYRKIERGKKWKSSTRSKVEINLRLLVESKSCSLDRSISSLPRENEM